MKRKWSPTSSDPAAFDRQFDAAHQAGREVAATEPAAEFAAYHQRDRTIEVRLRNGSSFSFPIERNPELAGLPDATLAGVEVTASGRGLHWKGGDVHLSVPHLMGSDAP